MDKGIAAKLLKARQEIPPIPKSRSVTKKGYNAAGQEWSYAYSYADINDVLDKALPALAKHDLIIKQAVNATGGAVVVTTAVVDAETGAEEDFGAIEFQYGTDSQKAGAAITYARRYAISAALCLALEEDDDANSVSEDAQSGRVYGGGAGHDEPRHEAKASIAQVKFLERLAAERGGRDLCEVYASKILGSPDHLTFEDLTKQQASRVIESLKALKDEAAVRSALKASEVGASVERALLDDGAEEIPF